MSPFRVMGVEPKAIVISNESDLSASLAFGLLGLGWTRIWDDGFWLWSDPIHRSDEGLVLV